MSDGEGLGSPSVPVRVLPSLVLSVSDLLVAGVYVPAGPGADPIAGDFWDVLPVGAGLVSVLLGDVSGHGEPAVTRMRALRSAAQVCVAADARPASVLQRLDTIMQALGLEDLATLWCGLYNPVSGQLIYSSAGHPPPALRLQGQPSRSLALADAPPLGTGFLRHVREHTVEVPPGAVLVVYSDGLIERHGAHFDDQLALLGAVVDAACEPPKECVPVKIAADVMRALVPEPDKAEDDVCLLVVRRRR